MIKKIADQIPCLLYFQNGGIHTGSYATEDRSAEFRYKISPSNGVILAEAWRGPFCYDKSEISGNREFRLAEDGLHDLSEWLSVQCDTIIGDALCPN